MSYVSLNDIITDEDVLKMAKEHLENNTFPMSFIGSGKTTLTTRIILAMLYLMEKENEKI